MNQIIILKSNKHPCKRQLWGYKEVEFYPKLANADVVSNKNRLQQVTSIYNLRYSNCLHVLALKDPNQQYGSRIAAPSMLNITLFYKDFDPEAGSTLHITF